jgi:hypothetical protein
LRRLFWLLTWLVCWIPQLGFAQISVTTQDLGEVYQCMRTKSDITLGNATDSPIKILGIKPLREGDKVLSFPTVIPPKSSVYVPVEVFSARDSGYSTHWFHIDLDDPEHSKYSARVHGFGLSVLDDALPTLDLGVIDTGKIVAPKTIVLSSREVPDFQITRVIETPDFVDARILSDHHTLEVDSKANAAWGKHLAVVKVGLNSTRQPEAWIKVSADIHGDVIPSQNPLNVGVLRTGEDHSFLVQLKSRNGQSFGVNGIKTDGIKASVLTQACTGIESGCVQLQIRLGNDQPTGRIAGNIRVNLPEYHQELPIEVTGMLLDKDAKVISLDEQVKKSADGNSPQTSANPAAKIDIKSALEQSIHKESTAAPETIPGKGPLLKWKIANEQSVYGYLIYRSDSETGPFLRVNNEVVRVQGDGSAGLESSYQWRDNSAESGKLYWYYIGMLNKDGTKPQLSGPQKVVAK